ncbi:MAG: pro-sigmaK processing inhibitor BofA [Clostridiales bacterium]|jgi:inhibitor of the pro-sigma K processing machinery|nr:pro-sigmaK processing inhibitor BofA [Clostridiales bacterium]
MGLDISFDIILAYASGLVLLYFIGWLLLVPLKLILRFLFNAILGGIALWLINTAGKFIGISVAINPVTALTVGFLGIPGLILILLLQYVIL